MKRKIISLLLACIIVLSFFNVLAFADDTSAPEFKIPEITSGNLVVVRSVDTGQILLDTSENRQVAPTVSAKLVATMVAYDMITSLEETVTVPPEALLAKNIGQMGDISAPMLGLTPNGKLTVRQLITASLVSAANDACFTLAFYASGGDIPAFVEKMNEKAKSLGCQNTKFTNPVGLTDGESYTTPTDVAIIASAFYKYNTLLNISSQPSYVLGNTIHTKNYLLSNVLLKGYTLSGAKGMIAGQARIDGGYCLITSAEKAGLGYVMVVMEAPGEIRNTDGTRSFPEGNAYQDIHKVFNWAITSFGYLTLVTEREIIGEIPVDVATGNTDHVAYVAEKEVDILMPVGISVEDVEREVILYNETLEAPVEKDMIVGRLNLYYNGEKIASVSLVTNSEIERSKLLSLFGRFKAMLMSSTTKKIIRIIIAILVGYFILVIVSNVYRVVRKADAIAKKRAKKKANEKKKLKEQSQKAISDKAESFDEEN
ncbi:MAG: D-alanyl-D-alanine carboxypeptidase family protein [Eubacteriales bacterium]